MSTVLEEDKEDGCLEWSNKIYDRYPVIYKMLWPVLSIIHGPRVESTFSVMGNVVDQNSRRMNMKTYGAIQC